MKTRKFIIATIIITSVVLATGCAGKFKHEKFSNKIFSKYDENGDGYISKKEHLDIALERFERSDKNDDGKVSKEELKELRIAKKMPNFVDAYFKNNDHNSDGLVSKYEIFQQAKIDFMKSDKNEDNKLTKSEIQDFKAE